MAAPTNANVFEIVGWSSNKIYVAPAATSNLLAKEFLVRCSESATLHVLLQTRERLLCVEPDSCGERSCEFAMGSHTSSHRCVHFCNENERPSRLVMNNEG